MAISLFTNYWLSSTEKLFSPNNGRGAPPMPTTIISRNGGTVGPGMGSVSVFNATTQQRENHIYYLPLNHIRASYGLWEMCKVNGMR